MLKFPIYRTTPPPMKIRYSFLAIDAVKAAMADYRHEV